MKYQGKQYGLVFYTDYMGFFYNPNVLKQGGFDNPPTTWDEAQQMAVALKEKKIVDSPFDFDLSKASNSSLMWLFWTMAFGDGGHIFAANNDPLWPDKDPSHMKIVTFLTDAVQKYKTLDPARIQPSSASIGPLDAGLAAFGIGASYGLPREQNTQYTKIPGVNKMTHAPSFHKVDRPGHRQEVGRSDGDDEDGGIRIFDIIYIITGGGPGTASTSIACAAYRTAFDQLNFGVGNAYAYSTFLLPFAIWILKSYFQTIPATSRTRRWSMAAAGSR